MVFCALMCNFDDSQRCIPGMLSFLVVTGSSETCVPCSDVLSNSLMMAVTSGLRRGLAAGSKVQKYDHVIRGFYSVVQKVRERYFYLDSAGR